ncbi:MAG: bifunctional diaminohydroxyphosphoribosylaminopyrimidine deaminase/5-amino-6-(5-phosphoribosylamino)uracil reductase RibD [Patescibacteria group bacterium]
METKDDKKYMARAFTLAQRVPVTAVAPNPRVGALVVKRGKVIGEGYHARLGSPHAEAVALSRCKVFPRGATLYVTLEPCCHWGKTPPCTEAIIKAGIKKVVYATKDPNPAVQGEGITALRHNGIQVQTGAFVKEAMLLNEAYFFYHRPPTFSPLRGGRQRGGLPFVAVKIATSLDGRIATRTGDAQWITSVKARSLARNLRGRYQAILVGVNTVFHDNPHLGVRVKGAPDPVRIIIDPAARIPLYAKVLRDSNVIVCVSSNAPEASLKKLQATSAAVWQFVTNDIPIHHLLKRLGAHGICSVLVEGGGETIGRFFDARAVQKVHWFHAPLIIGGHDAIPSVGGVGARFLKSAFTLTNITRTSIGPDILTIGYVQYKI